MRPWTKMFTEIYLWLSMLKTEWMTLSSKSLPSITCDVRRKLRIRRLEEKNSRIRLSRRIKKPRMLVLQILELQQQEQRLMPQVLLSKRTLTIIQMQLPTVKTNQWARKNLRSIIDRKCRQKTSGSSSRVKTQIEVKAFKSQKTSRISKT